MKESKKGTASTPTPDLLKGQEAIKGVVLTKIVIESKEIKSKMKFGKMLVSAAVFSYAGAVRLDTEITGEKVTRADVKAARWKIEKMWEHWEDEND